MPDKTIEQQVADAILGRDKATFEIGGETYAVGQPSIATLILISEAVSTLPAIPADIPSKDILRTVLHHARDCKVLGDIAAILILGAKEIRRRQSVPRLLRLLPHQRRRDPRRLARRILENVSASALFDIVVAGLDRLDVGRFFALTTSLAEANILKPTKEVEPKQTVSGQQ